MTMKQGTHESGRSMIEMLGVLAIIGVLSVGGIAGYSQAMSKFKVSKTTDQVQTMVTNIRTLFTGQRTYKGLTGANAYTMGILTDETWDGTNASNAYGGSILFGTPNNQKYFSITYNGLSQDACTRLVMADWGDSSSGLIERARRFDDVLDGGRRQKRQGHVLDVLQNRSHGHSRYPDQRGRRVRQRC